MYAQNTPGLQTKQQHLQPLNQKKAPRLGVTPGARPPMARWGDNRSDPTKDPIPKFMPESRLSRPQKHHRRRNATIGLAPHRRAASNTVTKVQRVTR